jgi:alkanesulfonate monooxygenase SsuD/methylene tetrahydromethanopterin reductase-like flavin-dependent oxidoreductase (luciferase family)
LPIQLFRRALQKRDITATGWLASQHGGIASAATAVVIGHVAAATWTVVGAGGIMLPNHAPLVTGTV